MILINTLIGKNDKSINNNKKFRKTKKEFSVDIAKENLRDTISVLNKFGITHWLLFGTMLGCVRDNDFIKYDTDIDIGCFQYQYREIASAIKELEGLGFELIRVWKRNVLVSIIRNGVYIDLCLFDGPKNEKYFCNRRCLTQADLNFVERDFLGFKVNIMLDYERILSYWYGIDWIVPKKGYFTSK